MSSQTPQQSQKPQSEKEKQKDEEENQPEEKENNTDGKEQETDEEKEKTFFQKWCKHITVVLSMITIIVSIVMPLTLKKIDRKYWGGESCKTNENCFSKRCDLDLNICFCKDEEDKDYCRDSTFMCIDKFQCVPKPTVASTLPPVASTQPTAAPICASSILIGNENKLLAEDASTDANFGWSISIDRSIAVVGAYKDGSAYVLERSGSEWKEVAKLTSDTSPPDFGTNVAIDGDTIIVGARGSAYVFQNTNGSEWDFVTKLEANDGYDGDRFGMAVALDGNTAIVGAVGDGTTNIGFAYVFVRINSEWAFQDKIFAVADGSNGDRFGRSVAIHGDTAIVGKKSSAYIFNRNGSKWDFKKRLIPKDAPIDYMFGYNVALNDDTAVIGAIGAAYIFTLSGSEWSEEKMLTVDIPDLPIVGSVALDENSLILGSGGHNSISSYIRDGFEWKEAAKLTANSVSTDDQFGYSIAVSENVVMIGAPGLPGRQGSIYIMDYVACV